jgi:hypothetical protein
MSMGAELSLMNESFLVLFFKKEQKASASF